TVIANNGMNFETIEVNFLGGLITNVGITAKNFSTIVSNWLANRYRKAVNDQELSIQVNLFIHFLPYLINQLQ
ncbi:hypothetical protein HMPREF3209_00475, partial [Lactobacillus crispatus]